MGNALRLGSVAALVMLSVARPAAAQPTTVAILPTFGGDREIAEADRDEAYQAAVELLRTEDLLVLDRDRVETSLTDAQRACAPGQPCAEEVRARVGVDLLVGLVIWGSPEARHRPESVHASILDVTGTRYIGSATVQEGVGTAVRDALRSALRDQRRGPGPFLRVEGTRSAVVELDGTAVGTVPLTVRAEPGEHELRVSLEGYEAQTLSVTVTEDRSRTTGVRVELRRGAGGGGGEGSLPDVMANLLVAGGLAAAGIVAMAVHPIPTLAREGECVDAGPGGACAEWVTFDAGAGVMLGVGAALVAAGIGVAIAQPITVSVGASSEGASLILGGSF